MKRSLLCIAVLLLASGAWGQQEPKQLQPIMSFHNCSFVAGDSNMDGYQTMGEYYKCTEGVIKLKGKWTMIVDKGWIYNKSMGRISEANPTPFDKWNENFFKWCPYINGQLELCGMKETKKSAPPAKQENKHVKDN